MHVPSRTVQMLFFLRPEFGTQVDIGLQQAGRKMK